MSTRPPSLASPLARVRATLQRWLPGQPTPVLELHVGTQGPHGAISVPNAADGEWELLHIRGRQFLTPSASAYYLYCVLPDTFRALAPETLWVEVEYLGARHGEFRLHYASRHASRPDAGLYEPAQQHWSPGDAGLERLRRCLFELPAFDAQRTQNQGASFRLEFRSDLRVAAVRVSATPPAEHAERFPALAPLPELRKLPGRFYPINYLFVEITNACNFKCTWCPDEIMDRRRGFMKKAKVFRLLDEVALKRAWLGPLYPVKLHQMGEPMLHPDLAEIVGYAESRGVPIELNTNCGLIDAERIDALYGAGLTNLILSYQTPDSTSFETRKAPRLSFEQYRDKVRLAVERKVATRARTQLEIDIMNTKHADGFRIVSEDEQALAFVNDWVAFCQELERRHGLTPRSHAPERLRALAFLDQDENGSRYELLDGVTLIWKRCHSWGNVMGEHPVAEVGPGDARAEAFGGVPAGSLATPAAPGPSTYCPAPYDQFVIHWNGDVVSCCTDYEGRTKTANVFAESIEGVWRSQVLRQRRQDMLAGRLLDVCAQCQGLK
jgi:MoaA/NifB/PqqE/SkfB family radical SAM enzyme